MTNSTPGAYQPAQPLSQSDEKLWGMLAHLGGILSVLPSLLIYLILKDRSSFVGANARNALNFQILLVIVQIANFIVGIPLGIATAGLWVILQGLIAFAAWAVGVIFSIIGGLAANKGEVYRYPFTLPLVK